MNKRSFWIMYIVVTLLSFIFLILGMYYLFGSRITFDNIIALSVLSNIFGVISSTLYILKFNIMFSLFLVGIAIGFFQMFRIFLFSRTGWEDIAGVIYLITFSAIGLFLGAIIQLFQHIFRAISKKSE